jgi:hypothetical protein
MKISEIIAFVTLSLLGILALTWIVQGNDFLLYRTFAPKQEEVRREVFEQTKSYNEGMAQEIRAMQLDYVKANDEQKKAIASIVLHRVAGYDLTKLPPDLRAFVRDVGSSQGL